MALDDWPAPHQKKKYGAGQMQSLSPSLPLITRLSNHLVPLGSSLPPPSEKGQA